MSGPFIVIWHHGSYPRYRWSVRGIHPDRSFYGDMTAYEPCNRQISFKGRLSEADYLRLVDSCDEIQEHAECEVSVGSIEPWEGLVAVGPMAHPAILYRYRSGGCEPSVAAVAFLRIIEILLPYLRDYELSLCEATQDQT